MGRGETRQNKSDTKGNTPITANSPFVMLKMVPCDFVLWFLLRMGTWDDAMVRPFVLLPLFRGSLEWWRGKKWLPVVCKRGVRGGSEATISTQDEACPSILAGSDALGPTDSL